MLLSEAPSGVGLTRNVALPGFPAGFERPGTGLSTPAGVRSISTSALARVKGALSLIGSGPVSHEPKLMPRLARPAASRAKVMVADPSSPGARATSTWVAAPRSSPSPAIFSALRSASNEAVADSSFSSARNFSIWRLSSAPLAWNCVSSGRAVFPSLRSRTRSPSACPLTVAGSSREARLAAQRFAHEQIGERVGRSGHVRLRGSVDDRSRRGVGDGEGEIVRLHAPRWRQDHRRVIAGDGEFVAGEGSRTLIGHHHRQAGHEVDADVAGGELAVQAFARQAAFVRHCVEVGGGPIGFQRSLKPPAVQILRAPFAHVGIDELRPQTNEIGRGAGAGVDVELERRSFAVRRGLGLDRHVDGRSARREAIEDELGRRFEEAGVEDHGLEGDRIGAGPLRTELRAARLEMRGPDPGRIGRRRHPALRLDMGQAGENLKPVDAKPPRILIPGHGAARFVDEKRHGVGVVDAHASGADA